MGNFEEKYITYFSNDEFNQSAPKWLNNFRLESLNSFKRAGASSIVTYFANEIAKKIS